MNRINSIGLRVKLKDAEHTRKYLLSRQLLRSDLKIKKDLHYVYFPIIHKIQLNLGLIIYSEFQVKEKRIYSYKEIVNISEDLKEFLPTSYDIVGGIILIRLPDKIMEFRSEIGSALLNVHKNIRTVCMINPVKGEFRTRKVQIIAGEQHTDTIHVEYGLRFFVDVSKTFFSPRLAAERKRVTDLVQIDEVVVDLFCGVGPFSVMIGRYAQPRKVVAVDKNRDAVGFAKRNIAVNNVLDKVEVFHKDAREIKVIMDGVKADRIIMNLPFSAFDFFPYALDIASNKCVIHYYDVLAEEEVEKKVGQLRGLGKGSGFDLLFSKIRKIKSYGPREFYMGIDIRATKNADVA